MEPSPDMESPDISPSSSKNCPVGDNQEVHDVKQSNLGDKITTVDDNEILPNDDEILPNDDEILPNDDEILPNDDEILPNDKKVDDNGISLMPTTNDPGIWSVPCRQGDERKTALLLMRKSHALSNTDEALKIKSAFVPGPAKGYVYIEADNPSDVLAAIEGVSALNRHKLKMIPIPERIGILKIMKVDNSLKPHQWVRVNKVGLYRNDLAQVDHVDEESNEVHLKLLPRIDTQTKNTRPSAKLFDAKAVCANGGEVVKNDGFYIFEKNKYTQEGFLIKSFPLKDIKSDGVQPSSPELKKFGLSPETIALKLGDSGDDVKVCDNDLLNFRELVVGAEDNRIGVSSDTSTQKIKGQSQDLKKHDDMKITLSNKSSAKYISPRKSSESSVDNYRRGDGEYRGGGSGCLPKRDQVRIIRGPHKGHVGFFEKINDDLASVELHSSCQKVTVNISDISPVNESINQKNKNDNSVDDNKKNTTQTSKIVNDVVSPECNQPQNKVKVNLVPKINFKRPLKPSKDAEDNLKRKKQKQQPHSSSVSGIAAEDKSSSSK